MVGILNLKYHSTDNDNFRVYFTSDSGSLYCINDGGKGVGINLYHCAESGEPEYKERLDKIKSVETPKGNENIDLTVAAFIREKMLNNPQKIKVFTP